MQKTAANGSVAALGRSSYLANGTRERRFSGGTLLVVGLALLLLFVGIAQKAYRLSLPTTGWSTMNAINSDVPVFERNLLGHPSLLLPGDRFVALEGLGLREIQARAAAGRSAMPTNYEVGERVEFTVERAGRLLKLAVPLYYWTPVTIVQAFLASVRVHALTWLGFFIAAWVFWKRPDNTSARLMFLYYVTQFVIHLSWLTEPGAGHSISDLLLPASYVLMGLFSHIIFGVLLAPLILHLCLSFPTPKALIVRFPWLLIVVYLLPWLVFVAAGLAAPVSKIGLETAGYLLVGTYLLLGATSFVHTFATMRDPVRRAQVRWVALGFAVLSLQTVGYALGALDLLNGPLLEAVVAFPSSLVLTTCLAVAVLHYRLFDIDVVINRTVVYGALSACVVGLYAFTVGALGVLLNQENLVVSLVATGVVAVLFQPLRERLQRLVNRLLYGEREEPYALLARLGEEIERSLTPERVVPTVLETITHALKLPFASVHLYRNMKTEVVAEHGDPNAATAPLVLPLVHQGEVFGELQLEPRSPDETFSPGELTLLRTIAQQVSVAAYAVRQTLDLRRSRERLITAREEERLRIRRDLHDGLGPTLAGLNLQAGSLKRLIKAEPEAARAAVDELQHELRSAVGEVRRLVHDLRPPSLDQLGLKGALEQLAEGLDVSAEVPCKISTDVAESLTLPPATEVAIYRIVQEALSNALKHARASYVAVTLKREYGLRLTIKDNGIGVPEHYRAGVGLCSMRERVEELCGSFEIISRPQQGTIICVSLPYDQT